MVFKAELPDFFAGCPCRLRNYLRVVGGVYWILRKEPNLRKLQASSMQRRLDKFRWGQIGERPDENLP